jgi:uncharacterized protein YwqG
MTLKELVEEFAQNVAAQTDAIWRGDARTGNRHARRYLAAFEKLRALGNEGRDALAVLLTHPRMDVRVEAAAHLLRYRTAEARAVLEEAAAREGLIPFIASQVLKNWEAGTWALDLEEGTETTPVSPPPERVHVRRRAPRLPSPRLRLPASLKPYRSALQKALAPCILLNPQEGQAESRGCRYGGLPLVPPGTGWPQAPTGPLPFVGQLDFAELSAYPGSSLPLLPRDGILSVFYDIDGGGHWGSNPEDSAFWKLLWTPHSEEAVPLHPPPELLEEPDLPTRPYRLQPLAGLSLPEFLDTRIPLATENWDDEETEDYVELLHSLAGGEHAHQVGGYPAWIQEDAREEAQRLTGGPPEGAREWNLLWQLSTDEEVGLQWGSSGKLFLLMRDEDLRACRFERAWLVLQST